MKVFFVLVATLMLLITMASASVSVEPWGRGEARLYTLHRGNMTVSITDWGATVTSLRLPDPKTGENVDIVLGFDTIQSYTDGASPFFGAIVGRVANRIRNARFSLNETTYFLTANDHGNTLHGGFEGYNKMFWRSQVLTDDPPAVELLLYSYDTEQGFPGDIDISVTYALSADMEFRVTMRAFLRNKETPVSLAHHSYWNLGGHNSGSILNHTLQISASHYTPVDELLIPTGEISPVEGTAMDFRQARSIGSRITSAPGGFGYDHNFAVDKRSRVEQGLFHDVTLEDPASGRKMEVWSNQPGLQFYSGNQIVKISGKNGFIYRKYAGLCLETQGFPDAVNQPNFPSVLLKHGHSYKHVMVHKFK